MKIIFDEYKYHAKKSGICAGGCGRRLYRRKTFTHTVNPFNKNLKTGLPKTEKEVQAAVIKEGMAWEQIPVICECCLERKKAEEQS